MTEKISSLLKIIVLNLKILFNLNSVELNKNRIQLLNEYFKINNYNRVIKLYEKMLPTFDFNNSDVQLLKNICSAYNNTKNFTKLLITIEKIFELKFLSKEDICYFRMYKGISFLSAFYFKTSEFAKSLATSMELLNHSDIFEESFVLASMAINQYKLNQFEEAEKNIKKAKLLNSKTKNIKDIIDSYYNIIIKTKN